MRVTLALLAMVLFAPGCDDGVPAESQGTVSSHFDRHARGEQAPAAPADGAAGGDPATPPRPPTIPMYYQYRNDGDWLMSRTAGEGAPDYHYTGIQYRVFEAPVSTAPVRPLYRCLDAYGTHYQSPLSQCESEGSTFESLLGYIYQEDQGDGTVEIWRCISPTGRPIISTPRLADCNGGGYIVQFSLGWAYPAEL